jgi:eukaryotic-like serine/threonine-protein kinase
VELDGDDYSDKYGLRALWVMFTAGLLVGALGVLFVVSRLGDDRPGSTASSTAPAATRSTTPASAAPITSPPAAFQRARRASTAPITSPAATRSTTPASTARSVDTVRNGDGPFDPGQGSVPADWVRYPSPSRSSMSGRWSIATPGWRPHPAGQFLRLRKPGYGYVAVGTRPAAGSPRKLVDDLAGAFGATQPAYRSLGVRSVRFRGVDATDWEFTYRDSGTDLHALVRGFVIDGTGYLVWFQTNTFDWAQAQGQRNAMLASFRA